MLFATEREAGTYDFQRSLPLSPAQLLLGKCAFALCSVVVLYVVSWLAAVIVSGVPLGEALENPPKWSLAARSPGQLFQLPLLVSLFFALELFLWSVLFSLLLRQPLTAAIAGAAAAAIYGHLYHMACLAQAGLRRGRSVAAGHCARAFGGGRLARLSLARRAASRAAAAQPLEGLI